jgi:hypothetical protein
MMVSILNGNRKLAEKAVYSYGLTVDFSRKPPRLILQGNLLIITTFSKIHLAGPYL